MQTTDVSTSASSDGFLLLDEEFNPIVVNTAALQILLYPNQLEAQNDVDTHVAAKVHEMLVPDQSLSAAVPLKKVQSGRRVYVCRSFPIQPSTGCEARAALAIILERSPREQASLSPHFEKYNLTGREQEVAQLLSLGLTSKQIGLRMQISPNTVKAFLRLIMVKMGVSTRSGIVGKAFTAGA